MTLLLFFSTFFAIICLIPLALDISLSLSLDHSLSLSLDVLHFFATYCFIINLISLCFLVVVVLFERKLLDMDGMCREQETAAPRKSDRRQSEKEKKGYPKGMDVLSRRFESAQKCHCIFNFYFAHSLCHGAHFSSCASKPLCHSV